MAVTRFIFLQPSSIYMGTRTKEKPVFIGRQTLPPTQSLTWTWSVLVRTVLHEIAFQCSECLRLPAVCLVRHTLPLQRNPSPPISSLRGTLSPSTSCFQFFRGNGMTKRKIRLLYYGSHPRKQDAFTGLWHCSHWKLQFTSRALTL